MSITKHHTTTELLDQFIERRETPRKTRTELIRDQIPSKWVVLAHEIVRQPIAPVGASEVLARLILEASGEV